MPKTAAGRTGYPGGIQLGNVQDADEEQGAAVCVIALDNPALASTNRVVTSANMKVGAYTIANATPSDGLARNVTVTATQVGGVDDTPGTILVTGLDLNGSQITETLAPLNGSTVAGTKAFKSVSSVVGSGWVINTGNDTLVVGFGTLIGLPIRLRVAGQVKSALLGTSPTAAPTVAVDPANISGNTIDVSSLTYDGAKDLRVTVAP